MAKHLINAAGAKAREMLDLGMRKGYLALHYGMRLLQAYVDTLAEYGAQVWEPSVKMAKHIDVVYARIYRAMLGGHVNTNQAAMCLELGRLTRRGHRDYLKLVFFAKLAQLPESDSVKRLLRIRLADHLHDLPSPCVPVITWSHPKRRGFLHHVRVALHSIHHDARFESLSFPLTFKLEARRCIEAREFALLRAALLVKSLCLPGTYQFLIREDRLVRQPYLDLVDSFARGFLCNLRLGTSELYAHARNTDYRKDEFKSVYDRCPACQLGVSETVEHFLFDCWVLFPASRAMWTDASTVPNRVGHMVARAVLPGGVRFRVVPGARQRLTHLFLGSNTVLQMPHLHYKDVQAVQRVLWSHLKSLYYLHLECVRNQDAVALRYRFQI
jgi:hypothetical protein